MNYYNEHDPKAAAWLRALIAEGIIPPGEVDTRSIIDVQANELTPYAQCHFFAGIGGWPYALSLVGWPIDRPVWTGSCPCQPFSDAGQGMGEADERHLWPDFRNLIGKRRPPVVFGEQVASSAGLRWLDGVCADLEAAGYAIAAADLCAASVGAPHIRQRLYWVAHTAGVPGSEQRTESRQRESAGPEDAAESGASGFGLAHANGRNASQERKQRSWEHGQQPDAVRADRVEHAESNGREQWRAQSGGRRSLSGCSNGGLGNADKSGPQGWNESWNGSNERAPWATSVALACADGKARRIEPGSFPLAHGISGRVGLLRGYGNAIVPQVAARFVEAWVYSANEKGQR